MYGWKNKDKMINIEGKLADGTQLYGWKSDPPKTPFAPDYAHYITYKEIFSEEECKEWDTYLLEQEQIHLEKYVTSSGDGRTGLGDNSITSRYGSFNVLRFDFHLVSKLKTEIFNGIKTVLSVSDNTNWQETFYANAWFNVMRKTEFMDVHTHGYHMHSFYGFHVSISARETATSYYHPTKFQSEGCHIPNKIGYLTLFPNFVPHGVSGNRYDTPRISIAGDVKTSTWLNDSSATAVNLKDLSVEIGTYNNNSELQE